MKYIKLHKVNYRFRDIAKFFIGSFSVDTPCIFFRFAPEALEPEIAVPFEKEEDAEKALLAIENWLNSDSNWMEVKGK